ncbi:c-type cytochrome [Cyanobacterium sp. uoEpiScrs1]|uniref:c-type cytochrome n=1 Tax=Cyanobacterium sp. uoEpiScrs1 TaxID=2976343 RepID=UPI00226A100F|nr:cytochrome c [Cyanobacterium sp. uoEpiScrs1]
MTNQFTQLKDFIRQLIATLIATIVIVLISVMSLYLYQVSDLYVKNVLSLEGDVNKGREIFEVNCIGCNGLEVNESLGPSLYHVYQHKSKIKLIHQVTSGKHCLC